MKKMIMAVASLIAMIFTAQAQLENVAVSKDSSLVVTSVYMGMLATTSYLTDRNKETVSNNFRAGGSVAWKASRTLQLKSWGIFDVTVSHDTSTKLSSYSLHAFWLQWQPSAKWQFQAGKGATLSAQQYRPLPASNQGQFETWTQAQFPGLAPVINIKYMPRKSMMFAAGVSSNQNQPEYQVAATFGQFKLSGFYQDASKRLGGGVGYASKNSMFSTIALWKQKQLLANITIITLNKAKGIVFFNDFGYDPSNEKVQRWEIGILKSFNLKPCKGLFSVSWQQERKALNAYFYLTL
jgi:hypothetical protein